MDYTEYLNLTFFRMPESVPQADRGRLVVDDSEEEAEERRKKSSEVVGLGDGIEKAGLAQFLKNLKFCHCLLEKEFLGEFCQDNLSEWLRRQTRNLLGFARAGSNPAVVVFVFYYPYCLVQNT